MPAGALQAAADQAERFDRMKYGEFWPRYLQAHADRRSRALHYLSTSAALACIAGAAIAGGWRWLVAAPVVGYGPADWRVSSLSATGRRPSAIRFCRCLAI